MGCRDFGTGNGGIKYCILRMGERVLINFIHVQTTNIGINSIYYVRQAGRSYVTVDCDCVKVTKSGQFYFKVLIRGLRSSKPTFTANTAYEPCSCIVYHAS